MGTGIRVPSSPESLIPSHHALGLLWSSPIYHANMYIRNKAPSPGKRRCAHFHHWVARVCQMRSTERNTHFFQTLFGDQICNIHFTYPHIFPAFFFFFFFLLFFKGAVHLKIKQTMSPWNPDCSIYCMLPISHLFLPLRNPNLPHGVQRNLPDFALYCFLHASVFKEDPSFEQQLTIW